MRRGTTPTHTFNVPLDITSAEAVYVTYRQNGKTVVEKSIEDVKIDGDSITVKLEQADTLLFSDGLVQIQVRVRLPDQSALASNVITTSAKEILKEGEI